LSRVRKLDDVAAAHLRYRSGCAVSKYSLDFGSIEDRPAEYAVSLDDSLVSPTPDRGNRNGRCDRSLFDGHHRRQIDGVTDAKPTCSACFHATHSLQDFVWKDQAERSRKTVN